MRKIILLLTLFPFIVSAQLQLPYSIKLVNPLPIDYYYFNTSLTPYASTAQILSQVVAGARYRGQTFFLADGTEYTFRDGIADGDLVIKGTGSPTYTAGNGLTLATSLFKLGGTLTEATTINANTLGLTLEGNLNLQNIAGTGIVQLNSSQVIVSTNTEDLLIVPNGNTGTSGQVLTTDGTGKVNWTTATGTVNTASNGLTLSGSDVKLGGTLTEATTLTGTDDLVFNISNIPTNRFSQISIDSTYLDLTSTNSSTGYSSEIVINNSTSAILHTQSSNSSLLSISGSGMLIQDNINSKGLVYDSDYSSNYTSRSLVDKNYVDAHAGGITNTAVNNEITKSDGTNIISSGIFSNTTGTLSAESGATPGLLQLSGGDATTGNTDGGNIMIMSGVGHGTGRGGYVTLLGSNGGVTNSSGGDININPGSATGSGNGGSVSVIAGDSPSGDVGVINLQGGTSTSTSTSLGNINIFGGGGFPSSNGSGGSIYIFSGNPDGSGLEGSVNLQTRSGGKLSFFNATPVVKQSSVTTSQGIANVLTAYGLLPSSTISSGSGTVTNVSALTLGITGTDLSSSVANPTTTPVITLNVPTASASNRGALSSSDWSTFNGKESALTFSTGLTRSVNTITVNTSQDINTLSNLTSNGLIKTSGGTGALSIATAGTDYQAPITFGTGVQTALGVNVGTAGAFVVNGGALGTPSSGTLTNATGLPWEGLTGAPTTLAGYGITDGAKKDGSNWTFTSQAIGDIIQASSTTAYSRLAAVATGNVLISGGVGTASSWGKVTSSHVNGTIQASGLSWLLASGGTLTGANTITNNTANGLLFNGTFTAAASTDKLFEIGGSLTANSAGGVNGAVISSTLNASGTSSQQAGLKIANTFAGGTTPVNYGLYVIPSSGSVSDVGRFEYNQNSNTSVRVYNPIAASGTAGQAIFIAQSDAGAINFGVLASTFTTSGINIAGNAKLATTLPLNIGTSASASLSFWTNTVSRFSISSAGLTTVTQPATGIAAGTGFQINNTATDAASNTHTAFSVLASGANSTVAQTTTAGLFSNTKTNATSGTNVAVYANASGATTANLAIRTDAGSTFISNASGDTPTASTRFEIRGISGGTNIIRLATAANGTVFRISDTQIIDEIGTLVGSQTTQNVYNSTVTTVNAFGSANIAINMGANGGTFSLLNPTVTLTNATVLNMNGASPSIVSSSTGTGSVFNTNILTGNIFGAATTIGIGATTGTTTINNATVSIPTSGSILKLGGGATASELRFLEPSAGGSEYTAFKAVAQTANITYSLPATVGSANSVLTDAAGTGVLSWAVPAGSGDMVLASAQTSTAKKTFSVTGGIAGLNIGANASDPTTTLAAGDMYYQTSVGVRVYSGSAWSTLGGSGLTFQQTSALMVIRY